MEIRTIEPFIDHFRRLRERTVRVFRCVPEEQVEWHPAPGRFSFGDLMRHLAGLERYMYAENALLRPSRYPGHDEELARGHAGVLEYSRRLHAEAMELLATLAPEDLLKRTQTPAGISITVWKWLRTMPEHEAHHRGQIYFMLGLLGVETQPIYGLTSEEVKARSET